MAKKTNAENLSQAEIFARTRDAHSREVAEDYVETVADLIRESGEARVTEIAKRLGVTHVTVIRTLARLEKQGWVTTRPYKSILLTRSGQRLARRSRVRHGIVRDLLIALGVDEETARTDAEGIEHHVSTETLRAFARFLRRRGR